MKRLLAIYFLVIISTLLLFSCNESIVETTEHKIETNVLRKETEPKVTGQIITSEKQAGKVIFKEIIPKEKLNDSIIYVEGSKAPDCKTRVETTWEFRYFIPKTGKYLGVWPKLSRYNEISKISDLATKWGFTYCFLQAHLDSDDMGTLNSNGFPENKVMVHLRYSHHPNPEPRINEFDNAYAFYVDECYSGFGNTGQTQTYGVGMFSDIEKYISTNATNSLFITSDYKPSSCVDEYVQFTDYVMYSAYSDWNQIIDCLFYKGSDDQRDAWENMKNRYGNKNNANWMNAYLDRGSFYNLLNKANNLGQNIVWYYEPDQSDNYLDYRIWTFGNNAWQAGFLRRFSQKVTRYYRCYSQDCATCESDKGIWFLYKTIYGAMREDLLPY